MTKPNVAVLVSGGGTNLEALLDYQKQNAFCPYNITCVISDTKSAFALERAKKAGVWCCVCSPKSILKESFACATKEQKRLAVSNAILDLCKKKNIHIIVLAGFLTILQGDIITQYSGKIINLHPALLPKFGGPGMWGQNVHKAVILAGEKQSGCTVHLVDANCDTGKILLQKKVPVLPQDTPETLYKRIAPKEHCALIEGLCLLANEVSKTNKGNTDLFQRE